MMEIEQVKKELETLKNMEISRTEEIAKIAVRDKQRYILKHKTLQVGFISLCIVISVIISCFTYYAVSTMKEQQYALNMQFASMVDLISRLETIETSETRSVAEFDDNGNPKSLAENKKGGGN